MFFECAIEANNWLSFDCGQEERERYSWAYPDMYEEWLLWRKDAGDLLDFLDAVA